MPRPIVKLGEHIRKIGVDLDTECLVEGAALLTRLVMDMVASHQRGAERHERGERRETHRNSVEESATTASARVSGRCPTIERCALPAYI
jgi:hypothetical protein